MLGEPFFDDHQHGYSADAVCKPFLPIDEPCPSLWYVADLYGFEVRFDVSDVADLTEFQEHSDEYADEWDAVCAVED